MFKLTNLKPHALPPPPPPWPPCNTHLNKKSQAPFSEGESWWEVVKITFIFLLHIINSLPIKHCMFLPLNQGPSWGRWEWGRGSGICKRCHTNAQKFSGITADKCIIILFTLITHFASPNAFGTSPHGNHIHRAFIEI